MESFGLFNFLKSMLDFSAQPSPSPTSDAPVSEPTAEPQSAMQSPAEKEASERTERGSQEAVLQFMAAHEARAKRTRKK